MAEFKKPYDKAYEFWHVTTEGDCEGRSTTDLGVFEENIKGAITMAELFLSCNCLESFDSAVLTI